MSKFIIQGGKKLSGEIWVSGNKNAILPIITATLLVKGDVLLDNVPHIKDVAVMGQILRRMGAVVEEKGDHRLLINTDNVNKYEIKPEEAKQLRASVLFLGPLYARFGKVKLPHPGGDIIGRRGVETHLQAFEKLGAKVEVKDGIYKITKDKKIKSPLHIFLNEASVTATENLIMAVALDEGELYLGNAAREPHVLDLIFFLEKAGVKIKSDNYYTYVISGNKKLKAVSHRIIPDYLEEGTFMVLAAVTGGNIKIKGGHFKDLNACFSVLSDMNVSYVLKNDEVEIKKSKLYAPSKRIQAGPHPSFPTDLMSPFIVLATQAKGVTLFHDPMYESRMFFVDKLIRMGANITICDPHRVIVGGSTKLQGTHLNTPDIRAGIALVIAALVAEGESIIDNVEIIERGYENIEQRLSKLGADIKKV